MKQRSFENLILDISLAIGFVVVVYLYSSQLIPAATQELGITQNSLFPVEKGVHTVSQ